MGLLKISKIMKTLNNFFEKTHLFKVWLVYSSFKIKTLIKNKQL